MSFVVPALISGVSDLVIILLSAESYENEQSLDDDAIPGVIYRVQYLHYLAIIRLVLLLLPLPYHSYMGTAIRCDLFYQVLYGGTMLAVLLHMFSLSLKDPESLTTLFPGDLSYYRRLSTVPAEMSRECWGILILSLVSNIAHAVIYYNVRSTAPEHQVSILKKRRRALLYYASRRGIQGSEPGSDPLAQPSGMDVEANGTPADSPSNSVAVQNEFSPIQHFTYQYDDFMADMQKRFHGLKAEWSKKLEDFTSRIAHNEGVTRMGKQITNPLVPLTPFKVLLQLFAYEDVLENGKLDHVFDADDGVAITFFVPQLLSFLLHGAYNCAPKLENWILDKCGTNIHFAHRCFWFLRAWCLEIAVEKQSVTGDESYSGSAGLFRIRNDSDQNLGALRTITSIGDLTEASIQNVASDKFLPEERAAIEDLMIRVIEAAKQPATVLQMGTGSEPLSINSSYVDDNSSELSSFVSPLGPDIVKKLPIDPDTGYPSSRHAAAVTAKATFGFMPLDDHLQDIPEADGLQEDTEWFQSTPRFLDALIALADDLFFVPRERRKTELRKLLRELELQFLPSNSIYLPIKNVHHRVWRILPEESIALGTKERVPCIVCLEVIDYTPEKTRTRRPSVRRTSLFNDDDTSIESQRGFNFLMPYLHGGTSDADVVNEWRFAIRDPHRADSLFDKFHNLRDATRLPELLRISVHDHEEKTDEIALISRASLSRKQNKRDAFVDVESRDYELVHPEPNGGSMEMSPNFLGAVDRKPNPELTPSATTMGQWCSPKSKGATILITPNGAPPLPPNPIYQVNAGIEVSAYGSTQRRSRAAGIPTDNGRSNVRDRPPPVVFRENWHDKEDRLREKSVFGQHPGWRVLPILIKANDDLRQEQLASQLIYRMAFILARERVRVWLCPYEILAVTDRGGIIEAIPDTISLDSLKRNYPNFTTLRDFFHSHFDENTDVLLDAKTNFVESLAAYSIVCYLLQIKDRHNGNILLDSLGHVIHIDFGFFFLSSPGKNTGFESAPFKLTRDFVELMDGPESRLFRLFRELCVRSFITLRRHCMEVILLVEMLKTGNEDLNCFRGRPDDAIRGLRERFRLDLSDRACRDYVMSLVDESLENWRTNWYDRYQRYCVGVL